MSPPVTDQAPSFLARPDAIPAGIQAPESLAYRLKCALLGPPLTTTQLHHQRLSKKLALGVLSSDCISSSAYGSEEILLILVPLFGLAAYGLLLPLTGVVLVVLLLVTLTYRWVVTTYTQAGGSYAVARGNFSPVVAQVGAVALMLDYIVTVAVQAAAGSAAVTSALPALTDFQLEITAGVVVVLFYGNLRGLREAGRAFAFPTYFFVASMGVVILVGDLPGDHRGPAAVRPRDGRRRLPHGSGQPTAVHRRGLHPAQGVRQRRVVADRAGGDLQRGQRLQDPAGAQRPSDPRGDERAAGNPGRRHLLAGPRDPRRRLRKRVPDGHLPGGQGGPGRLDRSGTRCSSSCSSPPCSSCGPGPTPPSTASRSWPTSSRPTGTCLDG